MSETEPRWDFEEYEGNEADEIELEAFKVAMMHTMLDLIHDYGDHEHALSYVNQFAYLVSNGYMSPGGASVAMREPWGADD